MGYNKGKESVISQKEALMTAQNEEKKDYLEIMILAANYIKFVTENYIAQYPNAKKSFFGKSLDHIDAAKKLNNSAEIFLRETSTGTQDIQVTYYFFVKEFIETYHAIGRNDRLFNDLQKHEVINHFQNSLNRILQLKAEDTSQEFMTPYIILIKEKFQITLPEEKRGKLG